MYSYLRKATFITLPALAFIINIILLSPLYSSAHASNSLANVSLVLSNAQPGASNTTWTWEFKTGTAATIAGLVIDLTDLPVLNNASYGASEALSSGNLSVSGHRLLYQMSQPGYFPSGTMITFSLIDVGNPIDTSYINSQITTIASDGSNIDTGSSPLVELSPDSTNINVSISTSFQIENPAISLLQSPGEEGDIPDALSFLTNDSKGWELFLAASSNADVSGKIFLSSESQENGASTPSPDPALSVNVQTNPISCPGYCSMNNTNNIVTSGSAPMPIVHSTNPTGDTTATLDLHYKLSQTSVQNNYTTIFIIFSPQI